MKFLTENNFFSSGWFIIILIAIFTLIYGFFDFRKRKRLVLNPQSAFRYDLMILITTSIFLTIPAIVVLVIGVNNNVLTGFYIYEAIITIILAFIRKDPIFFY